MAKLFKTKEQEVVAQNVDDKYTKKLQIPQYIPSGEKPSINELFDDRKYKELLNDIYKTPLLPEVQKFLILAASRHIVFNYSKIADFYAHENKNVQRLMEESGLVIIDIEDAIANGYVRLSETIDKIMKESGGKTGQ